MIGANLISAKRAEGSITFCSYESVGSGAGGDVFQGLHQDPSTSEPVPVAMKRVDVKEAWDLKRGFNGPGPHMEPSINAIAAAERTELTAGPLWVGIGAAAGGVGGVLGTGGLLGCACSLTLMPFKGKAGKEGEAEEERLAEQQLQQHLDAILPRPASFKTAADELRWVKRRDKAAQDFMKMGGCRAEVAVVLVLPLADGGSMEGHVAKTQGGLNCSETGALLLNHFLFLALYLVQQLLAFQTVGVFLRVYQEQQHPDG